jgi:hypothetical protein
MSCKDNGNCCCQLEVVKDCICCNWTLLGKNHNNSGYNGNNNDEVDEQVIYTATGLCPIVSGKVEFCSATKCDDNDNYNNNNQNNHNNDDDTPKSVLVQFFRGNRCIDQKEVFLDSCIAFTVAKFDKIKVKRKDNHNNNYNNNGDKFTLSGNFCINANFPLH